MNIRLNSSPSAYLDAMGKSISCPHQRSLFHSRWWLIQRPQLLNVEKTRVWGMLRSTWVVHLTCFPQGSGNIMAAGVGRPSDLCRGHSVRRYLLDRAVAYMNSRKQELHAQELYKTKSVQIPPGGMRGSWEITPLPPSQDTIDKFRLPWKED